VDVQLEVCPVGLPVVPGPEATPDVGLSDGSVDQGILGDRRQIVILSGGASSEDDLEGHRGQPLMTYSAGRSSAAAEAAEDCREPKSGSL
jgi:hypothetical protein